MRNILLCLLAAASISLAGPAFASTGPKVLELPALPSPAQVKAAKEAFSSGDIVAVRGGDIASFDGLLNVSVAEPNSRHRQPPACVAAARKLPSGHIRTFYAASHPFAKNGQLACETSFSKWIQKQSEVENTDIPYWTDVLDFETDVAYTPAGNKITASGSVYRANSIDPQTDYYLVVFDSTSVDGESSYSLISLSPQISAAIGSGVGAAFRNAGPQAGSSLIDQMGETVDFPDKASGSFSKDGVPSPEKSGLYNDGSGLVWKWVYSPVYLALHTTATSAALFQVPAGTSSLTINLTEQGTYEAFPPEALPPTELFRKGVSSFPEESASGSVSIHVDAPFITVPSLGFAMIGAKASIDVQASSYLGWQITGAPLFVPESSISTRKGTATASTGADTVSFYVPASGESPGQDGTFAFDTQQPSASPATKNAGRPTASIDLVANSPQAGVLVAGGVDWQGNVLSTADVWNTQTQKFQQTAYPMESARQSHTATLIETEFSLSSPQQGKILIAGGFGQDGKAQTSTELFDPAIGVFEPGPEMTSAHADASAVRLQDGRILIIGGVDQSGQATNVADVYDPIADTFGTPFYLVRARYDFTATLLQNGAVLVVGGSSGPADYEGFGDAELLDHCGTGFYSLPNGLVADGRQGQSAALLQNGQVLIVGGFGNNIDPIPDVELYSPTSQSFSEVPALPTGRRWPALVLQQDGNAAIIGGFNLGNALVTYDASSNSFFGGYTTMQEERDHPTAVRIKGIGDPTYNGTILVAGGVLPNSGSSSGTLVELYDPTTQTWTSVGNLSTARSLTTSTLFGKYVDSLPAGAGSCN